MNDILRAMRERALVAPSFRQAILATRNAADPLTPCLQGRCSPS